MKGLERANAALTTLLGAVLLLGVLLNFANAAGRYLFGGGFVWAEEIMVFGMIFVIMLGTVSSTYADEHLRMDVVLQWLPATARKWVGVVSQLVLAGVCAYLALNAYTVVSLMMQLGQKSVAARIPTWIPHSFLLVSFALSTLLALQRAIAGALQPPPRQTSGAQA
jgi:TRAP-type C4-dicarboxylate transport system permease small subunit